ncbi:MAG: hypothetical protein ABI406_21140 [Ktedonobacteraceae bacterium]
MDSIDKEQEEVVVRVTAHYVASVQAGHQPDISDYLASYPRYADAIASFIAYYHAVESPLPQMSGSSGFSDGTGNIEETGTGDFADEFHIAVESAWQRVFSSEITSRPADVEEIASMSEIGKSREVEKVVYGQTLQSLFIVAKQQRLSLSQLAVSLDISEDIVTLLEQRALLPGSVPTELYRRLSATLNQSDHTVQNYSGMDRHRQVAEHQEEYNVEDTGNTRETSRLPQKVSFHEALENSRELSAEQRSTWFDVLTEEGL